MKITPDPRIAGYIEELETPSVVSYSHFTLARLWDEHGRDVIENLLNEHFAKQREEDMREQSELAARRQRLEEQAAEQGITVEQLTCRHEWNQSEGEADENGGRIYCLKCGLDGDA
jgi:hypothetical protein